MHAGHWYDSGRGGLDWGGGRIDWGGGGLDWGGGRLGAILEAGCWESRATALFRSKGTRYYSFAIFYMYEIILTLCFWWHVQQS